MDPRALLASEDVLNKVEAVCRRRFANENEANECYIFVLDGLRASDCKSLRTYKGLSSLNTFLYALINSLVADFKRKKYGRKRIPKQVSKLGAWAETLYRLVCWERYSYKEAYDIAMIEGFFKGKYVEFLSMTDPIRQAPCPENPWFVPDNDPSARAENLPASPLDLIINRFDGEKRMKTLEVIREVTAGLAEEDQLLIRLVYGSDLSVSAGAKVIGLKPATARKRLRGLLIKYREALLAEGIREP